MKRSVLLALSALMAGAMSLPAGAAGTNEKTPDSAATGATGTGSNAMDRSTDRSMERSMDRSNNADTRSNAATGASTDNSTATDTDTNVKKGKRKARHAKKSPDAAQNHGAVGGESAGKSSDSPAQ
jgi:hypothetical protein